MNKIKVSVPGKLMLFGEHAVVYNRPCIVTAVNQRMTVTAELTAQNTLTIQAPDVSIANLTIDYDANEADLPKGARFIFSAVKNFCNQTDWKSGLIISTHSEFSNEFGFGSSSAVTVGVVKALSELSGANLDNHALFKIAYQSVLDVQKVGSGFDLAAAIWGGTLYFVTGGKEIKPLLNNLSLVVGYTGIKANTVAMIQQVASAHHTALQKIDQIFDKIEQIVTLAKTELIQGNWLKLGALMNENQAVLAALGVNTPVLKNLISAALSSGALGAKLSGAGGGDCMIALATAETASAVAAGIEAAGGKVLSVSLNAAGVRIEE